jgi:hypothetical protein
MSWIDLVGFGASAMVLATFCMTRMLPLRLFAIVSNILFGAYGYLDHLYPVLLLHLVLLPVNCLRLRECLTETGLSTNPFDARSNSQARPPPTTGSTEHGRVGNLISSNDPWRCTAGPVEQLRFSCEAPEVERAV